MKNNNTLVIIAMSTLLVACGKQDAATESEDAMTDADSGNLAAEEAALQIEGDYMRGIVAEISDDRYEGRGPGSRGDALARIYLAAQMEAMGYSRVLLMAAGNSPLSWLV